MKANEILLLGIIMADSEKKKCFEFRSFDDYY